MWLAKNLWYFFLVPGLVLLADAAFSGFQTWRVESSTERVAGTIRRTWAGGTLGVDFQAEVSFTASDGNSRTFTIPMNSLQQFSTGEPVRVTFDRYDPQNPQVEPAGVKPWAMAMYLLSWGSGLSLLGGVPLYFRRRRAQLVEWLQLNGRAVQADFTGVHLNPDITVNDKNPWLVTARWKDPASGQTHEFKSANLWKDPNKHAFSKSIAVVIDPVNPARYWMDLSFLPPE